MNLVECLMEREKRRRISGNVDKWQLLENGNYKCRESCEIETVTLTVSVSLSFALSSSSS